jgi:hypothetical protein
MIQLHHAWGSLAIKPEEMASNLYNTLYSLSERLPIYRRVDVTNNVPYSIYAPKKDS